MRQPILKYNPIDFEEGPYDPLSYMKYKGEWFTGTLLGDDERSYTEYKDGKADGRYVEYYNNGQIACDCIFEKGECISEKSWYRSGELRCEDAHLYSKEGKLIRKDGLWLYPNGQMRDGRGEGVHYVFSSEGELAVKTIVNMSGDYKNTVIYYDDVLSRCFQELFINHYPEEDQMFYNLEYLIWGWAMAKYRDDKEQGLTLLRKLTNHGDEAIYETARLLLRSLKTGEIIPSDYLDNLGYHTVIQ